METLLLYLWLIPFILFLLIAIYVGFSDGDGEICAFLIFIGFIPVLNLYALGFCIIKLIFER